MTSTGAGMALRKTESQPASSFQSHQLAHDLLRLLGVVRKDEGKRRVDVATLVGSTRGDSGGPSTPKRRMYHANSALSSDTRPVISTI